MDIIVLEHPRLPSARHFNDIANTPLWSCLMGGYTAARLRQGGHDGIYWDAALKGWDFDRTGHEILMNPPALLCINAVYFWEKTPSLFDFIRNLRESGFRGHINLFGFFPTLAWRFILEEIPAVDSIAVGECEHTVAELADHLEDNRLWGNISGLASRDSSGGFTHSHRVPEKNPDILPFPLRLPNAGDTAAILASRGCYNHCSFCPIPSFYDQGPLWRGRSPENVFEEIRALVEKGITDFYFVDPNFVGPGKKGKARIMALMALIRPLGITFGMETRPQDLDHEILEHMRTAGFQTLLMGIESGSAAVLGQLNKNGAGTAAREAKSAASAPPIGQQAIDLCRAHGIEPEIGFLMFVPDSTLDDLKQNFEFLWHNRLLDRLERTANLLCHYQIVLSGTTGYERFVAEKRLEPCGLFGFEGKIVYSDPAVTWMAELVVPACLHVLKAMAQPSSPIYWETGATGKTAERINHFLVELFRNLMGQAASQKALPAIHPMQRNILRDLNALLDSEENGEHQDESAKRVSGNDAVPPAAVRSSIQVRLPFSG